MAGVTIYVLGLVGLTIPIYRTFTDDLATAWYAVSLLPRTVVAGHGVRIWVQMPLALTLLLASVQLVVPAEISDSALIVLLLPLALVALLVGLGRTLMDPAGWRGIVVSILFFTVGLVILQVVILFGQNFPLVYKIPALFGGTFLIGVPTAIDAKPPLPKVEITEQAGAITDGDSNPAEGHLVAHSDGFWHLFDQDNVLLSLPDTKVLAVRVVRKAEERPPRTEGKQTGAPVPGQGCGE